MQSYKKQRKKKREREEDLLKFTHVRLVNSLGLTVTKWEPCHLEVY